MFPDLKVEEHAYELLINLLFITGVEEGIYNVSCFSHNERKILGELTFKDNRIFYKPYIKEIGIPEVYRGLIPGVYFLEKKEDEKFYSFSFTNNMINCLTINSANTEEKYIDRLKQLNNYFPVDQYNRDVLVKQFQKHIENNFGNLLATFAPKAENKKAEDRI